MLQLLAAGLLVVDPVVTHEMPLEAYAEGFALLESGQGAKVILTP
jgi:threonine dehydrogenase-like Zn-dependent dehydrogenase